MTQVRETKAGKSISAWVVLKGTRHVATVQAHFSDSGRCTVNVWNIGESAEKCAKANGKTGERDYREYALMRGSAGGYGYDKFTAALSGLWIDGHAMTDHCGMAKKPPKGSKTWPQFAKPPKGWSFANYREYENGESGWSSCYRHAGLRYLEEIGYQVIRAI